MLSHFLQRLAHTHRTARIFHASVAESQLCENSPSWSSNHPQLNLPVRSFGPSNRYIPSMAAVQASVPRQCLLSQLYAFHRLQEKICLLRTVEWQCRDVEWIKRFLFHHPRFISQCIFNNDHLCHEYTPTSGNAFPETSLLLVCSILVCRNNSFTQLSHGKTCVVWLACWQYLYCW